VAMFNDVVHLSIRRKWSTQVDERNSTWRSRGISTKELLKKGQWQWIVFDLHLHMYRPCGIGHHQNDRVRLDGAEEVSCSPTTVSFLH
jgi:hypothetical protein